jgi:ribosomal protein S18 acetylase RimI-like enzyme
MTLGGTAELRSRFNVDDEVLSRLHDSAFGAAGPVLPWSDRLSRFSVSWVGAFDAAVLVGFVHAVWDGGHHAFLLDTAVDPSCQGRGIGRALVAQLIADVTEAGCEWMHVDYEPHLKHFYEDSCGFGPTAAGLLRLADR